MATIRIDHLDNEVVSQLKKRAARRDHSLEREVRSILEREVQDIKDMEAKRKRSIELVRKFQEELADRPMGPPSHVLIRQDRDEDHGHNW